MRKNPNIKSSGEISNAVLFGVLGIIIVVIIIVIINPFKKSPAPPSEEPKSEEPAYEVVINDVKFKLKDAKNLGNILKGTESKNPQSQQDIATTDKFIEVVITAENIGKENIAQGSWDLNDLFDSEERHFLYSQSFDPWIPEDSKCGDLLKPGFTATSCTRIYEVASVSTGLKVKVSAKLASSYLPAEEGFIDLGF